MSNATCHNNMTNVFHHTLLIGNVGQSIIKNKQKMNKVQLK